MKRVSFSINVQQDVPDSTVTREYVEYVKAIITEQLDVVGKVTDVAVRVTVVNGHPVI